MSLDFYWGDLHNHCSISYGHGTVAQALLRAAQQLDFCSVTGHAFWPDMPSDRNVYGSIIDYHNIGFACLARNWPQLIAAQQAASADGRFIAFPSYEWHSLEYGDHNFYARGPELPLRNAADLPALRAMAAEMDAIIIPHHIGYAAGYRGINWRHFLDDRSPFVEIYSLHGCSESAQAPYPMLHDMGPRDSGSTAEAGWRAGHRHGIIASTDHHGAYPGSHGDGRLAVLANALSRDSIWEALLARRVIAATGDKIMPRLHVNDAEIGQSIALAGQRHVQIKVTAPDALDYVELLKNDRPVARYCPLPSEPPQGTARYRLRITWGWGCKDRRVSWNAQLQVSRGTILAADSCFSGQAIVAPQENHGDAESPDEFDLPHEILERDERSCTWRSLTTGNLSMRHATTQAMSFEVELSPDATLTLEVNGQRFEHSAAELLRSVRSHFMQGWLSEAIQIGPLVPLADCQLTAEYADQPERDVDYYRLRVAQKNGQWAWTTPIWVERR